MVCSSLSHLTKTKWCQTTMTNYHIIDLQNYHLQWQTSHLRMRAQSKWDQKTVCLTALTTIQFFPEIRSHGVHWRVCDLATQMQTLSVLTCLLCSTDFRFLSCDRHLNLRLCKSSSNLVFQGSAKTSPTSAEGYENTSQVTNFEQIQVSRSDVLGDTSLTHRK